jgi:prephenate dehydrogenase
MSNHIRIAIIGGSGKMGRWLASFLLKEGHKVIITGRNKAKLLEARRQLGVEATTDNAEAVEQSQVVILSVPIDNLERVVKQISPHTQPEQIIIDITSIKARPVKIMHKHIKAGVVLGAHPMFGPGARSIARQSFVLTPTNEKERALAQKIKDYLETRDARVALMNPEEHDEMMTVILGLSHFIAIVSADTLLSVDKLQQMRAIGGSTFKLLITLVEGVVSEDPELYTSLQMHLPHITEIERLLQSRVKAWADIVENKDGEKFLQKMNALKDGLSQVNPNFSRAYENVYKLVEGL